MIMTLVALFDRKPNASEEDIRHGLRHNLCRCGAHIEIMMAARRATAAWNGKPQDV
jgi:nicotinate dehydrogenase subunit A